MEKTGLKCLNDYYVKSPSAIFKAGELVLGFGVWGSVIVQPIPNDSAHAFFVWVTLSSWLVVLITYILGLFRLSVRPRTHEELKEFEAPDVGDLIVNALIAAFYVPAISVYSIVHAQFAGTTVVVFVIVISIATFLLHAFHASTLVVYLHLGSAKWSRERRWVWDAFCGNSPWRQSSQQSSKYQQDARSAANASIAGVTGSQSTHQESGHEIYQDLS